MKIAFYCSRPEYLSDERIIALIASLKSAGNEVLDASGKDILEDGTDMLLSIGGDGTFLSASALAVASSVPVAGVNLGRMGFLSENRPEELSQAIISSCYEIEERSLLHTKVFLDGSPVEVRPFALNEVAVHRSGAAMLGVDVNLDGTTLPTYWADGLVVSTSSGSTAYSLSVGGPIVLPYAKVLILSPIAPHNLNVRPLVLPDSSMISLSMRSRDDNITLTIDNTNITLSAGVKVEISLAQFSLKRVRLDGKNFIGALTEKLFWGEDVRNLK